MSGLMTALRLGLNVARLWPHLLLYLRHPSDSDLHLDLIRWNGIKRPGKAPGALAFIDIMSQFPEFRNLFYYRTGRLGRLFSALCPPMSTLFLVSGRIGPGLFIQHGFATIVAAKEIGRNCWINQQVTIGFSNESDQPVLGDDVTVNAGAKVIGGVTVGSGSTVGANAVVVKDVPPRCTVVGVPARIVRREGIRVDDVL